MPRPKLGLALGAVIGTAADGARSNVLGLMPVERARVRCRRVLSKAAGKGLVGLNLGWTLAPEGDRTYTTAVVNCMLACLARTTGSRSILTAQPNMLDASSAHQHKQAEDNSTQSSRSTSAPSTKAVGARLPEL
jgi:hypothetical protein